MKNFKKLTTVLMATICIFMFTVGYAKPLEDDGIISLGDLPKDFVFNESDYNNPWTGPIPTYTEVDYTHMPNNEEDLARFATTTSDNFNEYPPTQEDTSLPDTTYFHMYASTYTDYAYKPSGSGHDGVLGVNFNAKIVSDSSANALARPVNIYIYDFDAGSSMLYKTYSASLTFKKSFWVGSLNSTHRYFFRVVKSGIPSNWWNKLDGSIKVSR